ncbi:MAG: permease [Gordonia sp. (in: high G+C Gram-positive bacteria)]|uniref:permease n=1 Tax=Gordonia sp. (in: high G+C Gram-positive bacteria) TaxID=84139 RepID=UPI0039E5052C
MSATRSSSPRGVAAILASAVLFGVVFLLSGTVDTPTDIVFGGRMIVTAACYALALLHPTPRRLLGDFWRTLTGRPGTILIWLPLCAIMGFQLWLFSWAPQHGHALDASLGYLILPLTLVLGGRFVLGDHVTGAQWAAVAVAVTAVTVKFTLTPQVSWVTFVVCLGYPVYFITRRRAGLDNPMAFGAEVAAVVPVAALLLICAEPQQGRLDVVPLLTIWFSGAAAMTVYLVAARLLTIPLFGLLGYVEPILLVVVSLLLGERMTGGDVLTYGLLAAALLLLAVDGHRTARRRGDREGGPPQVGAPVADDGGRT